MLLSGEVPNICDFKRFYLSNICKRFYLFFDYWIFSAIKCFPSVFIIVRLDDLSTS